MRIDLYLFEKGLSKSRSFAKTLLSEGYVTVNGKEVKKPSFDVCDNDDVRVTGTPYSFVSRGGVKLDCALEQFGIDVNGCICVDIGASSGGFTDCLLQRGASLVFAIDSGTDQLDPSLKSDKRVVSMENFNARHLKREDLSAVPTVAVTDVSFISQTLIIPAVAEVLPEDGIFVSLIKPQFECGQAGLGKGGIVKNKKVMEEAVLKVASCAGEFGLCMRAITKSPICGGDGNTEFLMYCTKGEERAINKQLIKEVLG